MDGSVLIHFTGAKIYWQVFSTDGMGLHFNDMLDMFSVFSRRAPLHLKVTYAFKIYDRDGDGAISREDIRKTLTAITGRTQLEPMNLVPKTILV